jgi:hypothetical protein
MLDGRERGDQGDLDPRDGPLSLHFHGLNFHAALSSAGNARTQAHILWPGMGTLALDTVDSRTVQAQDPGWSGTYNIGLYCSTQSKI